jgi:precorrin-3B synthase
MTIRGFCPDLATPMASGDGLLVRLHPRTPWDSRACAVIADSALRHGNGKLDLTSAGRLQLRGLRPETVLLCQAAMRAAGLDGPDDHLLPVPLARPATAAFLAALGAGLAALALPAKFRVAVLDGTPHGPAGLRAALTVRLGDQAESPRPDAVALAPPFGRLEAPIFLALAALAQTYGDGVLRPCARRGVVIAGVRHPAELRREAAALGLITDPGDPLLRVSACPGQPDCASASTATRADARRLASLLPAGATLHVSGCAKGCAHPGPADFTFVGRDGTYDLVRDGTAQDTPQHTGITPAAMELLK